MVIDQPLNVWHYVDPYLNTFAKECIMKRLLVSLLLLISSSSFAMTFETVDGSDISEAFEGDSIVVCNQESCSEGEVLQKVELKDNKPATLQRVLKNAQKVAIPGMALVVLTSLPTADGGPITGVVCAIACEVISNIGCGAGAWITATLNPAVGICYAAVCTALNSGAVTSCAAYCAALPTP